MGKHFEKGCEMRIGIVCQLQASGYSGGRYYAIMLAASLSEKNEVFFFTNNLNTQIYRECFADSKIIFVPYGTHIGDKLDFCLVFPGGEQNFEIHEKLLSISQKNTDKTILFSFETENWWNSFDFLEKKPSMVWLPWKKIADHSQQIVCVSEECVEWAREYYNKPKEFPMFGVNGPVNSKIADLTLDVQKKKQICFFTRIGLNSSHKGAKYLDTLNTDLLSGYRITMIYGGSLPNVEFRNSVKNKFSKNNIKIDFFNNLKEIDKFKIIAESRLLFYPEEFTGLGLPPLEATYCGTKTVCYKLPVLEKTNLGFYIYMNKENILQGLETGIANWKIQTESEKKDLQNARNLLRLEKYCDHFVEKICGE